MTNSASPAAQLHRNACTEVSIYQFLSRAARFTHRSPRVSIGAKPVPMQHESRVARTSLEKYDGPFDSSESSDVSLGDMAQYHSKNFNARNSSSSTLSTDGLSDESSVSVSERAAFFEDRLTLRPSCHPPPHPPQQRQETQLTDLNNRSMDLAELISTFEHKLNGDSQEFRGYQPEISRPDQRCVRRSSISRGSGVELELARRRKMIPTPILHGDASSSDDESVDLRSTPEHYGLNRSFRRNSMAGGTSSSSLMLSNSLFGSMDQENLKADIPPGSSFDQAGDSMKTEYSLATERQRLGYEDMDAEAVQKTKVNSLRPCMKRGSSFSREEDTAEERQRLGYENMQVEVVRKTKVSSLRPSMKRGSSFGREEDNAVERQQLGYEHMDAGVVQKSKVNSLRPSTRRGNSFGQDGDDMTELQRLVYEDMDARPVKETTHASSRTSENDTEEQVLLRFEDICGPESICRASLMSEPRVYARTPAEKSKGKSKKVDGTKETKPKVSLDELFGDFLLAMKASVDRQTSKQAKKQGKQLIKEIMAVMNACATRRKRRAHKKTHKEREPPMSPVTNNDIAKYCEKEVRAFLAKQQKKGEQKKGRKEVTKTPARHRRRVSV